MLRLRVFTAYVELPPWPEIRVSIPDPVQGIKMARPSYRQQRSVTLEKESLRDPALLSTRRLAIPILAFRHFKLQVRPRSSFGPSRSSIPNVHAAFQPQLQWHGAPPMMQQSSMFGPQMFNMYPAMGQLDPAMAQMSAGMGQMNPSMGLNLGMFQMNPAMGQMNPIMGQMNAGMAHMNPAMWHIDPSMAQMNNPYMGEEWNPAMGEMNPAMGGGMAGYEAQ